MNQTESILPWFQKKQQESLGFKVELTDLEPPNEEELETGAYWYKPNEGSTVFERANHSFFRGLYVLISGARREINKWKQVIIEEMDWKKFQGRRVSGYVALAHDNDGRYLVQAKAEAGNTDVPGNVLLAPTIQASFSNVKKHGKKVPLWDELSLDIDELEAGRYGDEIDSRIQPKDGGRFLRKNNLFVFQPAENNIKIPESHIWATREAIRELQKQGLVNEHLSEALGQFT